MHPLGRFFGFVCVQGLSRHKTDGEARPIYSTTLDISGIGRGLGVSPSARFFPQGETCKCALINISGVVAAGIRPLFGNDQRRNDKTCPNRAGLQAARPVGRQALLRP